MYRIEQLVLVNAVGQEDNLCLGHTGADSGNRLRASPWEIRIDETERRPLAKRCTQRRRAVDSLRTDLEPIALEQQADSLPCRQLALRDHDPVRLARQGASPATLALESTHSSTRLCPCAFSLQTTIRSISPESSARSKKTTSSRSWPRHASAARSFRSSPRRSRTSLSSTCGCPRWTA